MKSLNTISPITNNPCDKDSYPNAFLYKIPTDDIDSISTATTATTVTNKSPWDPTVEAFNKVMGSANIASADINKCCDAIKTEVANVCEQANSDTSENTEPISEKKIHSKTWETPNGKVIIRSTNPDDLTLSKHIKEILGI